MIIWKASTLSPWRASFRYRVALPAMYLKKLGIRSRIGWHARLIVLKGARAVVFSKTFHPADVALARLARARGIPVVYDLCDNIFVTGYPIHARIVFEQIAKLASAVVTTTPALAEEVQRNVPGVTSIMVIPDCVERREDMQLILKSVRLQYWLERVLRKMNGARAIASKVKARTKYYVYDLMRPAGVTDFSRKLREVVQRRLRRARRTDGTRNDHESRGKTHGAGPRIESRRERVVAWFGNHGGEYADFGMLDILIAAPALEALARRYPLRLRVISNNNGKFEKHIAPLRVPSEYVSWTPEDARKNVESSDVVIIPSTLNEFTRCKSANRLLLALDAGVPVVATRTPATVDFEGSVIFDDFERGLETYLSNARCVEEHLTKARQVIEQKYAPDVIAQKWSEVLRGVSDSFKPDDTPSRPRLVLLIHLVQDLDLILPIYKKAMEFDQWRPELWVTTYDLMQRAEMYRRLRNAGVSYQLVEPTYGDIGGLPGWKGVIALLTASESTADPHRLAYETVRAARRLGIPTYTMQHGFENVGLTYGDERFAIERVRFASDVVFIWGTLDSLHKKVSRETRVKCVPTGCPREISRSLRPLAHRYEKPIVGVFENLHSARYADVYRRRFVEDLFETMRARPDLQFLIKPHPAGQYLTSRYTGKLELPPNAAMVDPRAPEWLDFTAADILAHANVVVTSVTTVAFDAARAGKTVGVVGNGYLRTLESFRPLHMIMSRQGWSDFLKRAIDEGNGALASLSEQFIRRVAIPGRADERILNRLAEDCARRTVGLPAR